MGVCHEILRCSIICYFQCSFVSHIMYLQGNYLQVFNERNYNAQLIPCTYLHNLIHQGLPLLLFHKMRPQNIVPTIHFSDLINYIPTLTSASLTNQFASLLHNLQASKADCTGSSVCFHILLWSEREREREMEMRYNSCKLVVLGQQRPNQNICMESI